MGPDEREQPSLALDPLAADLGETGGDDDERSHTVPERIFGCGVHMLAGDRDHDEVDAVLDVGDRAVATDARNGVAIPVDGIRDTSEVALEDVAKELAADRPAARGRADDRHARRLEERPQ